MVTLEQLEERVKKLEEKVFQKQEDTTKISENNYLTYKGVFSSEKTGSKFEGNYDLSIINKLDERVATIFNALGSKERLFILQTILQTPCTAQELMEKLNLKTTGQVYHHLNTLQSARLIKKHDDGKYYFVASHISGFVLAYVGIKNMLRTDRKTSLPVDEKAFEE